MTLEEDPCTMHTGVAIWGMPCCSKKAFMTPRKTLGLPLDFISAYFVIVASCISQPCSFRGEELFANLFVSCVLFVEVFVLECCVVVLCSFVVGIILLECCVVILLCCDCEGCDRG